MNFSYTYIAIDLGPYYGAFLQHFCFLCLIYFLATILNAMVGSILLLLTILSFKLSLISIVAGNGSVIRDKLYQSA